MSLIYNNHKSTRQGVAYISGLKIGKKVKLWFKIISEIILDSPK